MGIPHDPVIARSQESPAKRKASQTRFEPVSSRQTLLSRRLLHGMKNVETALPFRMPLGTSILAWGRLRTPPVSCIDLLSEVVIVHRRHASQSA